MIPSAFTKELTTPAPRLSGTATILPPTFPSLARIYSRYFNDDTNRRETNASTNFGVSACWRLIISTTGLINCSSTNIPETGYPGSPTSGTTCSPLRVKPKIVGFPGLIATPCSTTVPTASIASIEKSFLPAEDPAFSSTRSHSAIAVLSRSMIVSLLSPATG